MEDISDNTPVRKNDPRTSVQKKEEYRFAANIPGDKTIPEKAYADYTLEYDEDDAVMNGKIPDVLLDVPVVKVDEINFELNDLRAKVNLFAKVLDLVELSVGVDAYLGRVKLVIQGVEAQALLKVRLDNVTAILDRVLTTIDRNPQIIEKLVEGVSSAVSDIGEGAGNLVGEGLNSAVEDIGSGAGQLVGEGLNSAVEDIGAGAGDLVGEGLNSAVEDIGSGAGELVGEGLNSAVEDIGAGAGSAVEDIGAGAGDLVGEGLNSAVEDIGAGAGSAVEDIG
jgi:phage-related protein